MLPKHTMRAMLRQLQTSLLACGLILLSTQAIAATETAPDNEPTSVDSVFNWGTWEFNIAPAAGALMPESSRPLNPRSAKVTLRTNSTASLAPNTRPVIPVISAPAAPTPPAPTTITRNTPPPPVTPPAPRRPPAPVILAAPRTPPPVAPPTTPATPLATPRVPVTPPPSPSVGVSNTSISGTSGVNLGF